MPGIEVLPSASARSKLGLTKAVKQNNTKWDSSQQYRHLVKHLQDLERDNYHDIRIEVPKKEARKKSTAGVKKILTSKRTFSKHLDEAGLAMAPYQEANASASTKTPRKFCSICGYWGHHACMKCGARYCSHVCLETHKETRCLKMYA